MAGTGPVLLRVLSLLCCCTGHEEMEQAWIKFHRRVGMSGERALSAFEIAGGDFGVVSANKNHDAAPQLRCGRSRRIPWQVEPITDH
jgi:hypothetical protein